MSISALNTIFKTKDEKLAPDRWLELVSERKGLSKSEARAFLQKEVPLESHYQKEIKDALKKEFPDALIVKVAQAHFSEPGLPDIMCIIKGHFFGIEVKRPFFGKPLKTQKRIAERIRKAGGTAIIASFPEDVLKVIYAYFEIYAE